MLEQVKTCCLMLTPELFLKLLCFLLPDCNQMGIGAVMFDQGVCFFLLIIRHVFLYGSCMWENCVCKVRVGVGQPMIFMFLLFLMAWLVLDLLL